MYNRHIVFIARKYARPELKRRLDEESRKYKMFSRLRQRNTPSARKSPCCLQDMGVFDFK